MRAEGRDCVLQDLEPGFCAEGEEFAFIWDSLFIHSKYETIVLGYGERYILHNHIVCGDAISRDKEEGLVIDFV